MNFSCENKYCHTDYVRVTGPSQVVSLVSPGAGLLQPESLDFNLDMDLIPNFLKDGVSPTGMDSGISDGDESNFEIKVESPMVRAYSSDEDVINGYYCYIHPYFPVLPPPLSYEVVDNCEVGLRESNEVLFHGTSNPSFQPSSPLTLAISAHLALIPHPDDPAPNSQESILLRRDQAQVYAQLAMDAVEIENEIVESMIDPGEALTIEASPVSYRTQIHPQSRKHNCIAPLVYIRILAAGQYRKDEKARRPSSYLSHGSESPFETPRGLPVFRVRSSDLVDDDPELKSITQAWDAFLVAQKIIATATQFVSDLESTIKLNSGSLDLWNRMTELERTIEPLVNEAETWTFHSSGNPASMEGDVARNLRLMARIKLNRIKVHRYCAFSDMPVFTKKHCDLSSDPAAGKGPPQGCGCSSDLQQASLSLNESTVGSPALTDNSSLFDSPLFPFSGRFSSKICMQSAFRIAQSFKDLTFPHPGMSGIGSQGLKFSSRQNLPRMVPIFSCCAMQGSYAMIMLCHRTLAIRESNPFDSSLQARVDILFTQLHEGVKLILDALKNYSIANEALTGMRDQIQMALESVATAQSQSSSLPMDVEYIPAD
ncbi:c6 zinc finger domain-containing protein [Rutstroemia sp. NJR-2017a BBW]|nr:c6 zinc finger domain-containing protein [Rutstroemia sp. NJR-2017a BBW]